jgi:hypothetical protein
VDVYPQQYIVTFSEDDDAGEVLVAIESVDREGQHAFVDAGRFGPWDDWPKIAAWIWKRLTLDRPVGVG